MRFPHAGLLLALLFAACDEGDAGLPDGAGDDAGDAGEDGSGPAVLPIVVCGPMLPASARPSPGTRPPGVGGDGGALPPALANSGACTEVTTDLVRAEAEGIAPGGFVPLGSAIEFTGSGGPFPHGIDFVVPCDVALGGSGAPASRIVVIEKRANGKVLVVAVSNVVHGSDERRLHFHAPELGIYQAAIPVGAGQPVRRHFTFRGLAGVSMGGLGAAGNLFAHPDRYDVLAVMGASPGIDLTYALGQYRDWIAGGFCDAASKMLGQLCQSTRRPLLDQHELPADFEHLISQSGNGVGLTLRRSLYLRQLRDLSRALGNPFYAPRSLQPQEPAATYLPPGVDPLVLALPQAEFCDPDRARAAALHDFFDSRFNPEGRLPVITFCDGGDSAARGLGVFDGTLPQTDPAQTLLAVDVNRNGARDAGEPVIVQTGEPFLDCGEDGLCDRDEPLYDAATNPDPAGDDYHYYRNPGGTEGNWRYDAGERYDDFGVDGVKGTCQIGQMPMRGEAGCYDYGEGNGHFDVAPGARRWYGFDPHSVIAGFLDTPPLAAEQLARLDLYFDAGIRDFTNDEVATNSLMAALNRRGRYVRLWEGFPLLVDSPPSAEDQFQIDKVDWTRLGRLAYVRYGDPDAPAVNVESTGDGRHNGSVLQSIHRAQAMLHFLSHAWPGGDIETNVSASEVKDLEFTTLAGRVTPYSVFTPPGYRDAASASARYPVVYVMHGYGMKPADLAQVATIASAAMLDETVAPARRLQKMILVFVDGACRPGGDLEQPGQMVPLSGDLCEQGAWFSDHDEGAYRGEQMLIELQARIERDYRTRPPADLDVVD